MATLADLCAATYKHTDRPDLVSQTEAAVAAALISSHLHKDYSPFYFDLAEEEYPTVGLGTSFSLSLPDRFRGPPKYCITKAGQKLAYVPPSALFDEHSLLAQTNIFYLAGANFSVRVDAEPEKITLGFYKLPSITDSWIANNVPECIALKAAATIYASIGNVERTRTFTALWDEQMRIIHASSFDL